MTTYDWLTAFNDECDKLKSEIIDQGMQQMVQSREASELVKIFQTPINQLAQQVDRLSKDLGSMDTRLKALAKSVSTQGGTGSTTPVPDPVDPSVLEKLEALAGSSNVNTQGNTAINIPAVGDNPRPTPYLEDKLPDNGKY